VFLDKFLYFFSVFRHKNLFTDVTQNAGNIATANPKGSFGKASLCEKSPRLPKRSLLAEKAVQQASGGQAGH
jgi:hypothetical protein